MLRVMSWVASVALLFRFELAEFSQGISDSYLQWRGIEATLQLAQSSNSKIVIVGTGRDGLPVILGNADAAPWPQPGNEESAPKERTTAATPATTAEKVPADTLLKPSKKVPSIH
jgi:hypothetical protein